MEVTHTCNCASRQSQSCWKRVFKTQVAVVVSLHVCATHARCRRLRRLALLLLCSVASQVVAHSDTESIRDAISLLGHTFLPALLLSLEQAPVTPISFVLSRLTMSSVLMISLCLKILLDLLQPACNMCVHVYTVHSCGVPPL
jgi:hypothetical protein